MGSNHPLGKAVIYSILLCAITHVAISFFVGVAHNNLSIMNMFHILGFDLFWPDLAAGATNAVLGVVMVVLIWVVFALFLTNLKKQEEKKPAKKAKEAEQ